MATLFKTRHISLGLSRELTTFRTASISCRFFSVLNRPAPNYEGHVPLTKVERAGLAVGSALMSLYDPRRHGMYILLNGLYRLIIIDMVAACGEATATPYFIYRLRDAMLADPTGRRILRDRPRISSQTLSVDYLRSLPKDSVGGAYMAWLDAEGVSPDTRDPVQYIDDEECAYVMQRYRECHDFSHAITGLPVIIEGELALKAFEFANTLLPMTGLSLFAVTKLKPAQKERFWGTYLPWAIYNGTKAKDTINVYWEEQLERNVDDLRAELGIEKPVDLRALRQEVIQRRKAEKEAKRRSSDSLGLN